MKRVLQSISGLLMILALTVAVLWLVQNAPNSSRVQETSTPQLAQWKTTTPMAISNNTAETIASETLAEAVSATENTSTTTLEPETSMVARVSSPEATTEPSPALAEAITPTATATIPTTEPATEPIHKATTLVTIQAEPEPSTVPTSIPTITSASNSFSTLVENEIDVSQLEIVKVEKASFGPYLNFTSSPDGQKALATKSYYGHQLQQSTREDATAVEGRWINPRDLWILDLATGQEEQIASDAIHWVWSPDSSRVAYITPVAKQGMEGALFVYNLANQTSRKIADVDLVLGFNQAAWLPNDTIVYIFNGHIWGIQSDGSKARQLNSLHLHQSGANEYEELAVYNGYVHQFSISPNGKQIAYTVGNEVWVADLDGRNETLVAENAVLERLSVGWSPNNENLIYYTQAVEKSPSYNLIIANLKTREHHLVYKASSSSTSGLATWSPAGDLLAFLEVTFMEIPKTNLRLTNTDGSTQKTFQNLSGIKQRIRTISWATDGSHILAGEAADGAGDFYQLFLQ